MDSYTFQLQIISTHDEDKHSRITHNSAFLNVFTVLHMQLNNLFQIKFNQR